VLFSIESQPIDAHSIPSLSLGAGGRQNLFIIKADNTAPTSKTQFKVKYIYQNKNKEIDVSKSLLLLTETITLVQTLALIGSESARTRAAYSAIISTTIASSKDVSIARKINLTKKNLDNVYEFGLKDQLTSIAILGSVRRSKSLHKRYRTSSSAFCCCR